MIHKTKIIVVYLPFTFEIEIDFNLRRVSLGECSLTRKPFRSVQLIFFDFYYWIQNTEITWNCIIDDKNQTWNIKHLIWFIQFSLFVIKNYNEKLFLSFELIVPTLPITFVRMQKKKMKTFYLDSKLSISLNFDYTMHAMLFN